MNDRYKLIGRLAVPCGDLLDWARWLETADRHVGDTRIGVLRVSTVFLGLDHSFGRGEPLLFETMIFGDGEDGYQVRTPTWDAAQKAHAEAVAIAEERIARADATINASAQKPAQGTAES
jgi:hypothetical protein